VDDTIKKPKQEKKLKPIPDKAFLEDNKEHVERVKLSLMNESEEGNGYDNYDNVYEDEYDDTYDSHDVGAADTDNVDELSSRRYVFIIAFRKVNCCQLFFGENSFHSLISSLLFQNFFFFFFIQILILF